MRKNFGLDVTDRINVNFITDIKLENYLLKYNDYIINEVLADNLSKNDNYEGCREELVIGEYKCIITIQKVS